MLRVLCKGKVKNFVESESRDFEKNLRVTTPQRRETYRGGVRREGAKGLEAVRRMEVGGG